MVPSCGVSIGYTTLLHVTNIGLRQPYIELWTNGIKWAQFDQTDALFFMNREGMVKVNSNSRSSVSEHDLLNVIAYSFGFWLTPVQQKNVINVEKKT